MENCLLFLVLSDNLFIFSFYISKIKINCIVDKEIWYKLVLDDLDDVIIEKISLKCVVLCG